MLVVFVAKNLKQIDLKQDVLRLFNCFVFQSFLFIPRRED